MHEDELSTLLLAERPRPREAFAAELDARVAARFAGPRHCGPARSHARARRLPALLRRPLLPAGTAVLAAGLVALVVALGDGGGGRAPETAPSKAAAGTAGRAGTLDARVAPQRMAGPFQDESAQARRSPALLSPLAARLPAPAPVPQFAAARKVERSASVTLGTDPGHVDDLAKGVLGVVARFDGIVDQSSVQTSAGGGSAQLQLRIPAGRLEPALAALSQLPDARVLARSDDTLDVNQSYVSLRRRLADARAERAGVLRALANAVDEAQTLRLRGHLAALDRAIAAAERSQRALDRRVAYSRVGVAIRAGDAGAIVPASGDGSFTIGRALHDALRVLEVAVGVVVIAAAALLPVALLAALAWPLARSMRRRQREQALS